VTIEKELTLLGFAGLEDPPRPEVRDAVRDCQLAGIRVRSPLLLLSSTGISLLELLCVSLNT